MIRDGHPLRDGLPVQAPSPDGLGHSAGIPDAENFHKLALNESIERVAQVAKERDAFNDQMAATATYAVLADKLARYSRILAGDYHPEDKEAARFHAKDACLSNLPTIIAALRANAIEGIA